MRSVWLRIQNGGPAEGGRYQRDVGSAQQSLSDT